VSETLPFSCVLLLGERADGAWIVFNGLQRALAPKPPVSERFSMDINPPEPWSRAGVASLRSTQRSYAVLLESGPSPCLIPRAFDAVVLTLSARRSVTARTRGFLHELAARARGPMLVCVTECAAPDGVPDLVEIEARELLSEFGFEGDELEVARLDGDDSFEALVEWLDHSAIPHAHAQELPVIARCTGVTFDGWRTLIRAQGIVSKTSSLVILDCTEAIDLTVRALTDRSAHRGSFGLGPQIARFSGPQPDVDDWVVDRAAAREVSSFEVVGWSVDPWLIDGRLVPFALRTRRRGAATTARITALDSRAGEGDLVRLRVEVATPVGVFDGMTIDLIDDYLREEPVFSAVVCAEDSVGRR
jgi:hypothetical protein